MCGGLDCTGRTGTCHPCRECRWAWGSSPCTGRSWGCTCTAGQKTDNGQTDIEHRTAKQVQQQAASWEACVCVCVCVGGGECPRCTGRTGRGSSPCTGRSWCCTCTAGQKTDNWQTYIEHRTAKRVQQQATSWEACVRGWSALTCALSCTVMHS
jgi:hypothetical protein